MPNDVDEPSGLERFLQRRADECDLSVPLFTADRFVVVAFDPQTGEVDSYGPYDARAAAAELSRRRTAFDEGDLEDVVVVVVPLWRV
ncbi:hypothetical protein Acsp07_30120 [Actinomycetospora sp. NBRC 106378]|nr:hypothetical protein Acsp07_30120 [Actinomycetospora sp. NBRC 106378]